MSKVEKEGILHVVAKSIFTDLTHELKRATFMEAGHFPLMIAFSDKSKATEVVEAKRRYTLPFKYGYTLIRSKRSMLTVDKREQNNCSMQIKTQFIDHTTDFDSFFPKLCKLSSRHFNANDPARIKELVTRNIATGDKCKWIKAKIEIGKDKKGKTIEELRLVLSEVNDMVLGPEDLKLALDAGHDMVETTCRTHKVYTHSTQVCSMVAKRMNK